MFSFVIITYIGVALIGGIFNAAYAKKAKVDSDDLAAIAMLWTIWPIAMPILGFTWLIGRIVDWLATKL